MYLINTNQPTLFQRSAVLETGLSDFHSLKVTKFKMSFQKYKPHFIKYWSYKNYDNDVFRSETQTFCSLNETDLGLFRESIFCIFNKHAPIRKKYLRANEAPFMTKELHNAIMKRSRYRNKFLKDKSQTSRENYKILRNLCKKLLRKPKKSYFESLNTKKLQIIETSGKLLFLFSQIRCQEMKRLSLMKQKNILLMINKFEQFLITSFPTLSQT